MNLIQNLGMHNFGNIFGNILDLFGMAPAPTPKSTFCRGTVQNTFWWAVFYNNRGAGAILKKPKAQKMAPPCPGSSGGAFEEEPTDPLSSLGQTVRIGQACLGPPHQRPIFPTGQSTSLQCLCPTTGCSLYDNWLPTDAGSIEDNQKENQMEI